MMKNRFYWMAGGALIGLAILAFQAIRLQVGVPARFRGSLIQPAAPAPDFSLPSADGQTFTLSAEQGQVVLIFFGYTSCPDVCPVTMAQFKQLRADLKEKADNLTFVFVTVDPQRDKLEKIAEYVGLFDPVIRGLTGTPDQLAAVWKEYGVAVEYPPGETHGGYEVSHTARGYAVDRKGNLRLTYPFGTPLEDLENDVRLLLKENPA